MIFVRCCLKFWCEILAIMFLSAGLLNNCYILLEFVEFIFYQKSFHWFNAACYMIIFKSVIVSSLSKNFNLPAKRFFEIRFLPQLKVTASTWPRQKTLLSQQVCTRRLRLTQLCAQRTICTACKLCWLALAQCRWMLRRKSPIGTFSTVCSLCICRDYRYFGNCLCDFV